MLGTETGNPELVSTNVVMDCMLLAAVTRNPELVINTDLVLDCLLFDAESRNPELNRILQKRLLQKKEFLAD